jgi:DNA-binding beta-propeller fold protein YncE
VLDAARSVDAAEVVKLEAVVEDDGLPSDTLLLSWRKLEGPGEVVFADPDKATTAVGLSRPGTYVLQLTADDGELQSTTSVTLTLLEAGRRPVTALTQVGHFATGNEGGVFGGAPLRVPSTDPAGIAFYPPTGHLFIADSEINEIDEAFDRVQANLFEVSANGGVLYKKWDLTANDAGDNKEPAGITYCANDGHFYIVNDSKKTIYRHAFDGSDFSVADQASTSPYSLDPEGVACDPDTGHLYVVGGAGLDIAVFSYRDGFRFERKIDLVQTAGTPEGIPSDPEGIAFDPISRHLLVVSAPDKAVFQFSTAGVFVSRFDISAFLPAPIAPQGLSLGSASADASQTALYIADGGRDNNKYPEERDGVIYEAVLTRARD